MQQMAERLAAARGSGHGPTPEARAAAPARAQHTVRAGRPDDDRRRRESLQSLMEKNQIADANSIREGQRLAIPEP
jgi:hypothetical protein